MLKPSAGFESQLEVYTGVNFCQVDYIGVPFVSSHIAV